jgi:MerR family regulatory protein
VADRTGVPSTTLRYYEEIGLLAPAGRRDNGYRAYSDRDVERLQFITRAKALDLAWTACENCCGPGTGTTAPTSRTGWPRWLPTGWPLTRQRIADRHSAREHVPGGLP